MTMMKVTVSLPEETAHGVEALVQPGQAASFSAYMADEFPALQES